MPPIAPAPVISATLPSSSIWISPSQHRLAQHVEHKLDRSFHNGEQTHGLSNPERQGEEVFAADTGPASPLTCKGQETRKRIASAAAEIFHLALARTTLDQAKAAAAVSSSQLYPLLRRHGRSRVGRH